MVYDIFDFYAHTHPLPSCITKIVESLEYLLLRYASKVIVCTEKRAQLLLDKTGVSSVVIFNTPNFELLTRRNQALTFTKNQHSSKSITIAYVGTLSCSGRLLKEVVDLACQTQGYQLYIAGIGPLAEYIKLAASSFPNVKWYGHISYSEAMSLQEESDLLFATYDPSILINKYAAPNKVYEAMALSKPVIVCRESEPEELVARYACGSAINYSINQFQDVVKFYQQNRDFLNIHGSNGFDAYKRYFNWSISEKKLVSVFEQ